MNIQGTKYLWRLPDIDQRYALDLAATYNMSVPIMQTLLARGYTTKDTIDSFIFSSFEKDVAHSSLLKDADKAVDRILYALDHQEKILVFGDYDVDGITSSALMMHCLLPLGAQVNFFLPHRMRDGYGLSEKVVLRAAHNGYKLIITVDNGTTAIEPARVAKEQGLDLIITDHHQPHGQLPDAFALVNPHQPGCAYPHKNLAGVGVIFKVLSLLYERKKLPLPPKAYELLLLGTIADVVPLVGENRFWIRHGLQYVHQHESHALRVLKMNGKVTSPRMKAADIGFSITPQINALGRLEDPRQGVKFLIGTDERETEHVGKILLELNQARKELERAMVQEVVADVEALRINLDKEKIILAMRDTWPPGVMGLVASRLVGLYGRPAILLHISDDGIAKGSCRSIPEFNMFHALQEVSPLLERFGGHAMAAGLAVRTQNIPELKERLEQLIAAQVTSEDLRPKIVIDAQIKIPDVTKKFADDLAYLEPCGNHNPQPTFYIAQVALVQKPQLLKDAHVKCQVFADGVIKPLIFFNRPDLYASLTAQGPEPLDIAVRITENYWQGRSMIELTGVDVALNQKK